METKKCSKCSLPKSLNEFNVARHRKDGRQTYCQTCDQQRSKQYYANNLEVRKKAQERTKRNQPAWIKKNYQFVFDYCKTHPCVDCGETDFVVLDFDHVGEKKLNIASALRRWSIEKIKEELKQCEVRCSNCHRRKTAKQFGWYQKYEIMVS